MQHRDDGGHSEGKFVAERDIDEDAEHRHERCDDGRLLDFPAERGAHFLTADGIELRFREFFQQQRLDPGGGAALRGHAQCFRIVAFLILDLGVFLADGRQHRAQILFIVFLRLHEIEGRAVATDEIHAKEFSAPADTKAK